MKEIGKRLKELREMKGYTQKEVADLLHISREVINMWENGLRAMKPGSIIAICTLYGVSADYLLGLPTPKIDVEKNKISISLQNIKTDIDNMLEYLKE